MSTINQRSILYKQIPYIPPLWLSHYMNLDESKFIKFPKSRYNLGQLPTPIHPVKYVDFVSSERNSYDREESVSTTNCNLIKKALRDYDFYMKRDDITSFDMSGNKLRKLEFLLAHVKNSGYDSVITIGGLQSNHCRATALAAKQLGLKCYLILRTSDSMESVENNLTGNLLFSRLCDAEIYTVTPSTYAQIGSVALTQQLCKQLTEGTSGSGSNTNNNHKSNPYIIPVGGSNEIGLFGYLDCVNEIITTTSNSAESAESCDNLNFDHVVFACGSGGTATGLGLGFRLHEMYQTLGKQEYDAFLTSNLQDSTPPLHHTHVHGVYVCDSAEYFYKHIEDICHELDFTTNTSRPITTADNTDSGNDNDDVGDPRTWIQLHRGVGVGYARSTDEELDFIVQFSKITGILLDPVYSGKALYYFLKDVLTQGKLQHKQSTSVSLHSTDNAETTTKQRILFIHTGGVVGLYDKTSELRAILNNSKGTRTADSGSAMTGTDKIGKVFKMKVEKP